MSEPQSSIKTKLYHSNSLTGEKKNVALIQGIPEFLKAPEPITYTALDIEEERQAKGKKKAENLEIEIIFTEEQYDEIKTLARTEANEYWFIQLPENTAVEEGKPLTWYFKATCFIGMSDIEDENMLKSKITLYRNTAIEESKGFPIESE